MNFDWLDESKERYFAMAENYVKENSLDDLLVVNRNSFTISKNIVRVYFKGFYKEENLKRWKKIVKEHPNIKERKGNCFKDEFSEVHEPILLHTCIEFELE